MANDIIIEQLRKRFGKRQSFSRQEFYDFYTEFKPDLKETTFRWIKWSPGMKGSKPVRTAYNLPIVVEMQ